MEHPITFPFSKADVERFYAGLGTHPDPHACHLWLRGKSGGRGRIWFQGETRYAYRVAWLIQYGEIPPGMDLISDCGNLACCNAAHYKLGIAKVTTPENLQSRFMAKTETETVVRPRMNTPCLRWLGAMSMAGRPVVRCFGKTRFASHIAYYLKHGVLPPAGLGLLHHCSNPPCVDIEHMYLGTNGDNNRQRHAEGRDAKGEKHGSRTKPDSVPRGERNGRSKLSKKQVVLIRRTFDAYPEFHGLFSCLSRMLGVGHDVIWDIAHRKKWLSVPENFAPHIQALPLEELKKLKKAYPRGEACHTTKVSDQVIREIRLLAVKHAGLWGVLRLLAHRYGLSDSYVGRIVNREVRGDLEDNFAELGDLPPLERPHSTPP